MLEMMFFPLMQLSQVYCKGVSPPTGITRSMQSKRPVKPDSQSAKTWPACGSNSGWTIPSTIRGSAQWICDRSLNLSSDLDHEIKSTSPTVELEPVSSLICVLFFSSASTQTCAPPCTAVPWLQAARRSGSLHGRSLRRHQWRVRPASSCQPWPVPPT